MTYLLRSSLDRIGARFVLDSAQDGTEGSEPRSPRCSLASESRCFIVAEPNALLAYFRFHRASSMPRESALLSRWVALLVAIVAVTSAQLGFAENEGAPLELGWVSPSECPAGTAIKEEALRLASADGRPLPRVRARVTIERAREAKEEQPHESIRRTSR
jgi:hypothetical protein